MAILHISLSRLEQPVKGCVIEGTLYQPLSEWKLHEVLEELKKLVAYTPKPVYVNGKLYGSTPAKEKWTHEDDYAYYRIVQGADGISVYNLGVFVEEISSWRIGCGGVVVSKQGLAVNFARNSVMMDHCSVWQQIRAQLESLAMSKLTFAKALTDTERKFLAGRISAMQHQQVAWRGLKLLTDPSGKHLPLEALRKFKRFVHIEDAQKQLGCAVHGTDGTFVVTDAMLNRFSVSTLDDFLRRMEQLDLVDGGYEVTAPEKLKDLGLGGAKLLSSDGLRKKESAALSTLIVLNDLLVTRLAQTEGASNIREVRVGSHRTGNFVAWTDGRTYITANRKYLRRMHEGVDGVHEWLLTLIHEYTHDTDDSESHDHGEVFYRKFHDTAFSSALGLASLARLGLKEYLKQLQLRGVPRPRRLLKQLRD